MSNLLPLDFFLILGKIPLLLSIFPALVNFINILLPLPIYPAKWREKGFYAFVGRFYSWFLLRLHSFPSYLWREVGVDRAL